MADKRIYTIPPDVYTTTPGRTFYDIPASAPGWYHSSGVYYKTSSGSDNILTTDDTDKVEFSANHQMDGSYGSYASSGNPCSVDGFIHAYKTNTNTPGYSVCVLATGSRSNLKSWNTARIPSGDGSMGMNNVVGCTFIGDNTGSDSSNSPKIYVTNVAFIYRNSSGTPYTYSLKNKLSGVSHWNESHERSTKIQGGYVDRGKIDSSHRFFGIVVQYWASKSTGTNGRLFHHKIRNLKFIIGNTTNPRTSAASSSNLIVLESGSNNFSTNDRLIWT